MEDGREKVIVSFQCEASLKEALEDMAQRLDRNVSWLIRHYVRAGLDEYDLPPEKDAA